MTRHFPLVAAVLGAGVLVSSLFSDALASQPAPFQQAARVHAKKFSVNGTLTISDVLRVQKNTSVYGKLYAHGGSQVWKGLVVTSGGIKADSLVVAGPIQGQSANIAQALQAGSISATSVTAGADIRAGGALVVANKISGNGVDAGTGGLTTTGPISGGALSVSSVNDAGTFSAGSLATSGTLTAGAATLTGLTVSGPVNFSNAQITGLNLQNINLSGATLQSLNVSSSLALGQQGSTSSPLTLNENGRSSTVGVNTSGALTVDSLTTANDLTVGGHLNLTGTNAGFVVNGSQGVTSPLLQAPTTNGTQGVLSLQGNGITLSNPTTLAGGSDLILSHPTSNSAAHIVSAGDSDVAGSVQMAIPAGSVGAETDASVTFIKPYASTPVITASFDSDPQPGSPAAPKLWVTASNTGFTIHYTLGAAISSGITVTVAYHVVGS